mgnify:CR=1 FL=1
MSEIKVNKVTPRSGTTVTLGEAGDTIALGACAAQTGFGSECMSWCSSVKTALFTAEAGKGYFINTCGGGYTVTLPATASVGDEINFTDYARTWATGNLTLNQNSLNFQGNTCPNPVYDTDGATVKIVYSGATKGWIPQLDKDVAMETSQEAYIVATGGTPSTGAICGDYKIHTFTGTGPLCVSAAGNACGSNILSYMVIAGGGGGGRGRAGGGGAGGFREGNPPGTPYSASPLVATTGLTASVSDYTITVGAAGGAATTPGGTGSHGSDGTTSVFGTITSAGGGGGGSDNCMPGNDGGSGGGEGENSTGPNCNQGVGNTPIVAPAQGTPGGKGAGNVPGYAGGGGGGAICAGTPGTPSSGGDGGDGATTSIDGTPTARAGGGGGSRSAGTTHGAAGTGGGGRGGTPGTDACNNATACTGGGGGAAQSTGGNGAGGIVIVRYKFQ